MQEQISPQKSIFPKWLKAIGMLVGFGAIGASIGWLIGQAARGLDIGLNLNVGPIGGLVLIVGCIVLLTLTLVVHELGHLVGGWLVGFRFILFVVGPLKVVREGDGVRVRLNKDISLYGGVAASMPRDNHHLPRRMAVMIAGGPLTSLLFSVLSFGLAAWFNSTIPATSAWSPLTVFALIFGLLNLAIFSVTIIPGKTSGFDTDGAQLLDALRGGHRAERRWLLTALTTASVDGLRPRDWNAGQMERLLALRTGQVDDALANFYGYYQALDAGQFNQAGVLLDLCLKQAAGFPDAARPMIFAEAAYFTALHRQNATAARQFLASATGGMMEMHTRLRAEAAVLLAEGQWAEAADKARAGQAQVHKSWDQGGVAAEQDWLKEILKKAEAQNGVTKE